MTTLMSLPPGIHDYEAVIKGIQAGRFCFAEAKTYAGAPVPIIGVSHQQLKLIASIAGQCGLSLILFGSRVVGPRTCQRKLHRVLTYGVSLESNRRHQSVGFPAVEGVAISKDAIKELGVTDPRTSDLSIAVITEGRPLEELLPVAVEFEREINVQLMLTFQVRVYIEIFGEHFTNIDDFARFGRERYIKKDLPRDHEFSDAEIEEAFKALFVLIDHRGSGHNDF